MKPHVICHMMASVDGHIKTDIWKSLGSAVFEEIAAKLPADVFDIAPEYGKRTAKKFALQSVRRLRKGVLWLRYRVRK